MGEREGEEGHAHYDHRALQRYRDPCELRAVQGIGPGLARGQRQPPVLGLQGPGKAPAPGRPPSHGGVRPLQGEWEVLAGKQRFGGVPVLPGGPAASR